MCIYYKDKDSLNYQGQEHIFPAAIGGIMTLPKGYVSDEFNSAISKLEQNFIRESFISIARQLEGPGKRGRQSEKYATKSKVFVVQNSTNNCVSGLAYIKLGKPHEILSIKLNIETGVIEFGYSKDLYKGEIDHKAMFTSYCKAVETLRIREILDDRLPKDIVFFGVDTEVEENHNAFFAKHPESLYELNEEIIHRIGISLEEAGTGQNIIYRPLLRQGITFRLDDLRVYGKIAFNFLAHIMGYEYARRKDFDGFRNWIAFGNGEGFVMLHNEYNFYYSLGLKPPSVHHVILIKVESALLAHISFYGGLGAVATLSRNFTDDFKETGLFCDWRSKKEYSLEEYIRLLPVVN